MEGDVVTPFIRAKKEKGCNISYTGSPKANANGKNMGLALPI